MAKLALCCALILCVAASAYAGSIRSLLGPTPPAASPKVAPASPKAAPAASPKAAPKGPPAVLPKRNITAGAPKGPLVAGPTLPANATQKGAGRAAGLATRGAQRETCYEIDPEEYCDYGYQQNCCDYSTYKSYEGCYMIHSNLICNKAISVCCQ